MPDASSASKESSFGLFRSLPPRALLTFRQDFDWRITGRWMLYSVLVGIAGALAAALFAYLLGLVSDLALGRLVGYALPEPGGDPAASFDLGAALTPARRWWLLVVPAAGGLLSGWLVYRFAPEAEGSGTNSVIRAFHHEEGRVRARTPLVKLLASVVTIGTGGSAGREGPIAQIGAALGALLAERFGLSARERRTLLVAGVAAGVSSIFRSPLGGAFFAVEVLYREDLETEALMQAVVAGITGYSVYSLLDPAHALFATPAFSPVDALELPLVAAFAFGCVVVSFLYVGALRFVQRGVFARLPLAAPLKPALGGLLVGVLALFFPAVLGSGYGWLQQVIDGHLPVVIMVALVLAKILATAFTIGSGGSGGLFAPSLVVGGVLGGLFAEAVQALFPALLIEPGAYVMIGMATFFAGVANVPLSTTIMISELTGQYTLLVPLILAAVLAHVASKKWSLYEEQVPAHRDSPVYQASLTADLLSDVPVSHVINEPGHFHTLSRHHTLDEMLSVFTRTQEVILPVRDEERAEEDAQDAAEDVAAADQKERGDTYSGLVLLEDVQSLLQSNEMMRHLVVAYDVEVPFAAVRLDDTLDRVLDTFFETQYPELPVLDAEGEIVGFVRQGQVINEYHRAYLRKEADAG